MVYTPVDTWREHVDPVRRLQQHVEMLDKHQIWNVLHHHSNLAGEYTHLEEAQAQLHPVKMHIDRFLAKDESASKLNEILCNTLQTFTENPGMKNSINKLQENIESGNIDTQNLHDHSIDLHAHTPDLHAEMHSAQSKNIFELMQDIVNMIARTKQNLTSNASTPPSFSYPSYTTAV